MNVSTLKLTLAAAAVLAATQAVAGPVGYGAATTGGGSKAAVNVSSLAEMAEKIKAYSGSGGLVLNYTGKFDFSSIKDVCAQWKKPAQTLEIKNKSDITIRGAADSSANFGIHIVSDSHNVIVQNMTIGLLQGGEAADSISIEGTSSGKPSNVWIDHNTVFASVTMCPGAGDASFDGGIDMKKGANHITVSYNYVHDYQKVALNGFSDKDTLNAASLTTYHNNRFEHVKSRLPLLRYGKAHIFNNYFGNVETSGINVRMGAMALIEANYFENARNPVTSRESSKLGYWDLRDNFVGSGITWGAPEDGAYANATDWKTTKAYGPTGYTYTASPAAGVKAKAIATAGARTNLAR
ncbi:polysaccharide lyase family 1 protein [Massilia sp. P8910]|uniref:pectate lyase family protein n=1 Tax=Massilia antarctica TaxID=2765360 RepID=UPI0006BB53D2|nr:MULTISPECIES: polysaccharide lyase family 1 protein [Massilia]MCE3605104.1 polysaccharide lyase family 1 protein [Massilia antarctica]MCY0912655.1 polysaccharide lyase family 1 protein [Massilia sp. H27-R4]